MSTPCSSSLKYRSLVAASCLLVAGLARAESTAQSLPGLPALPESAKQRILGHIQESNLTHLRGWPGMIFYCPINETQSQAFKDICTSSYQTLEKLAVQNHLQFRKAQNLNEVTLLPHLTGQLKLVIELQATNPSDSASAIAATVSVLAHYTRAINRAQELSQDDAQAKHPQNVPQHVDALLWEATTIKATTGPQSDLVKPVSESVDKTLEAFFADYAKANQ
jgi:hypothetical protein